MLKRKDVDETPEEILLNRVPRKSRQQFAGYTYDGTEDVGKTNVLLHSSKQKDEQVTKQDTPGRYHDVIVLTHIIIAFVVELLPNPTLITLITFEQMTFWSKT